MFWKHSEANTQMMQLSRVFSVLSDRGAFALASVQRLLPGSITLGVVLSGVFLGLGGKSEAPKAKTEPAVQTTTATLNPTPAPAPTPPTAAEAPLLIAYSDWPGWVAWDVALHKHWFDAAGVKVDFKWFEYVPSMEAFSAGKVDACSMTNGDQLVTGASGAPSVAILINDYSNGNDMVVARAGIDTVEQLKGKKVGVEVGFVSHLLLLNALKAHKLSAKDITIVNVPTDQTPQALKSGSVDAIVAWQPNSGQALKEVAGSKPVFTSKNAPGIIYDVLAVNPKSLAERHADWEKVVDVWFQVADFLADKKNEKEALEIMSGRVSLTPEQYAPLLGGTYLLGSADNLKHYQPGTTLVSIGYSSQLVDGFNLENNVYKVSQKPEAYLDSSLTAAVVKKHQAAPAVK